MPLDHYEKIAHTTVHLCSSFPWIASLCGFISIHSGDRHRFEAGAGALPRTSPIG
jgi:hypothetical protein